ncbi:hypothetical protein FEZ41_13250 [Lentilactobacillus parafarraginis]|nr:hypothetical protein FEZ41_13250 [Lentilactobacillus parafarraginis]
MIYTVLLATYPKCDKLIPTTGLSILIPSMRGRSTMITLLILMILLGVLAIKIGLFFIKGLFWLIFVGFGLLLITKIFFLGLIALGIFAIYWLVQLFQVQNHNRNINS